MLKSCYLNFVKSCSHLLLSSKKLCQGDEFYVLLLHDYSELSSQDNLLEVLNCGFILLRITVD